MKHLFRYFYIGALSLFPIGVVYLTIDFIVELLRKYFISLLNITNGDYIITSITLFLFFFIFLLLGITIEKYGKSLILNFIENTLKKIPLLFTLYDITKKIVEMFTNKKSFKEVVLVQYPNKGLIVPAYVTNKLEYNYEVFLIIFIPTSPNPTSGFTILINENEVEYVYSKEKEIKILTVEETTRFIISVGVDIPETKKEEIINSMNKLINKTKLKE